jgi:hypothetical protein
MTLKFDLRHGRRRLRLNKPAPAMVTGGMVQIIDVSQDGIGVESDFRLEPGSSTFVEFKWGTFPMKLACTVARCRTSRSQAGRFQIGLMIKKSSSPSFADFTKRVQDAIERMREAEAKLPPTI